MSNAGAIFLRSIQEAPTLTEHVKRSGGSTGLVVFFLVINIGVFLPFHLFFFYTVAQILPTIAVAADHETPSYTQIPLSDLYSDGLPSTPQAPQAPRTPSSRLLSLGLGISPMISQLLSLRTRFKSLVLFRGLSIFAPICIFEALVAGTSIYYLPLWLAVLPQILFPLVLVQLYTLWTHIVLTCPSAKSLWQRMPPFRTTLRATGPALTVFLAAKALMRFAVLSVRLIFVRLKPRERSDVALIGALILAGAVVELIAVVPAHMVLTRIQASLLLEDEKTVVPLDEALRRDGEEGEAVGMREAWRTFSWRSWGRLALLYGQVLVVVIVGGGVTLAVEFLFYIFIALLSM